MNHTAHLLQKQVKQQLAHSPYLIGVSGGVDSMSLLHILKEMGIECVAVHVDHQLRPSSNLDAQFVQEMCTQWHIPLVTKRVDVATMAQHGGMSLESAGREARYTLFAEIAKQYNISTILTAHHADDQTETVLMNLLRGTGLQGLGGMHPISPLLNEPSLQLQRPFLSISKADIGAYATYHQIPYREDESNQDNRFRRNLIRNEIRPYLETIYPALGRKVRELAQQAREDEAYLQEQVAQASATVLRYQDEYTIIRLPQYRALAPALQRRLLYNSLSGWCGTAELTHHLIQEINLFLHRYPQATVDAPNHVTIHRVGDWGIVARTNIDLTQFFPQITGRILFEPMKPILLVNGWTIDVQLVEAQDGFCIPYTNKDGWEIGQVAENANFHPQGMEQETTVKNLLKRKKIPAIARDNWPAVWNNGELVGIVSLAVTQKNGAEQIGRWVRLTIHPPAYLD